MTARVLIVDDSAAVRRVLKSSLEHDPDLDVVGCLADANQLSAEVKRLRPDVVLLDVVMPGIDGIRAWQQLRDTWGGKVLLLTGEGGDLRDAPPELVLRKPQRKEELPKLIAELRRRIFEIVPALATPVSATTRATSATQPTSVLAIAASTGGTHAVTDVLRGCRAHLPSTLVVQHMGAAHTAAFARQLSIDAGVIAREAADGDVLEAGRVLVAPGGRDLRVERCGDRFQIKLLPATDAFTPSVNIAFSSLATLRAHVVAVILTGMGDDGARGMLTLRRAGARCFVEDASTSKVYGMPRAALEAGGAESAAPLPRLPALILEAMKTRPRAGLSAR